MIAWNKTIEDKKERDTKGTKYKTGDCNPPLPRKPQVFIWKVLYASMATITKSRVASPFGKPFVDSCVLSRPCPKQTTITATSLQSGGPPGIGASFRWLTHRWLGLYKKSWLSYFNIELVSRQVNYPISPPLWVLQRISPATINLVAKFFLHIRCPGAETVSDFVWKRALNRAVSQGEGFFKRVHTRRRPEPLCRKRHARLFPDSSRTERRMVSLRRCLLRWPQISRNLFQISRNSLQVSRNSFQVSRNSFQVSRNSFPFVKLVPWTWNPLFYSVLETSRISRNSFSSFTKLVSSFTKLVSSFTKLVASFTKLVFKFHETRFKFHENGFEKYWRIPRHFQSLQFSVVSEFGACQCPTEALRKIHTMSVPKCLWLSGPPRSLLTWQSSEDKDLNLTSSKGILHATSWPVVLNFSACLALNITKRMETERNANTNRECMLPCRGRAAAAAGADPPIIKAQAATMCGGETLPREATPTFE